MSKYIEVDKLTAEIDKKWKELADKNVKVGGGKWDAEISTYLSVLRLIDSLQQEHTEVDLEKEINEYCGERKCRPVPDFMEAVARHFAKWGAEHARKEE